MQLAELIEQLEELQGEVGPRANVRLAIQPSWPFEHSISGVVEIDGAVYIAEGSQLGYLSGDVKDELTGKGAW